MMLSVLKIGSPAQKSIALPNFFSYTPAGKHGRRLRTDQGIKPPTSGARHGFPFGTFLITKHN